MFVINERAWFFSVHLGSRHQGKIDILRKDVLHCERLQSRGVKPEIPPTKLFLTFFFTFFDGITLIQGAEWAPGARTNLKKNHVTKKVSSSTNRSHLVPRGAVDRSVIRTLLCLKILFFVIFLLVPCFFALFTYVRFESFFFLLIAV